MAKTSKKNLRESTQAALLEPEPQKLEPESPPEPAMSEPEAEIDNQNEEPAANIEDGTTVETVETDPGKRVHGPKPNSFGQKDYTILDRLNALETWEGVWAYVYRIQPFSNRLVGGNRKVHVKRYDTAFDVQALMEEAGSGVYQIQATRQNRTTGQRPMFDTGEIRILNMNHPPKIPPGEWVDDPKNKEWLWAKEIIFKEKAPPAAPPPPDPLVGLLQGTIDSQREEMRELRQEIRAAANKKDPAEQTVLTILLQKVLEKPAPPPPPAADPVRDMLMTYLMKQLEAKSEPAKASDPSAELDRVLDLQDKIEARMGGGKNAGRSRKTGWQETITDIAAAVAPPLTPLFQMILANMMQSQRNAAQQPQPGMNPNQAQLPQPELTEVQQPHPGPGVGPRPVENRKQPTVEGFADQVLAFLKEGHDGYELGDWYVEQFGIDELNDLREQGKAVILKDLRSCPNPWRFIAVYEESGALDKFLREFVTWEPGVEDADEEEESPPDEPTAQHQTDMAAGWMPAETQEAI